MLVQVTVNSMGGSQCKLPALPGTSLVSDLALSVREHFGVPVCAQRLILDGTILTDPSICLSEAFGMEATEVELLCVRRTLTEEEQAELDRELVRCAASGKPESFKELVKEGANLQASSGGISTMMAVIVAGDQSLLADLKAQGIPEPDMSPQYASLAQAFRAKDLTDVARQIYSGADVNQTLKRGEGVSGSSRGTPLMACCALHSADEDGAYEVTQLLLGKKADMMKGDAEGDNALAHAKYFGANEILDLLKSHGGHISGPFYKMFGR
mmetsp:Transcript_136610/g.262469  ORF Transcript_136610/g.262469 Transcript_136610/m.262469 type:complete len:269 (+) Transcript_136610:3-809(+)